MYLMIQNQGEAPIEGYTLLGMSTARNCGVDGVIGKFGSGTKHAINMLLRKGIEFHIYCGKTRLEFFCKKETIDDGLGKTETSLVYCRLSGDRNKTIDCGWCLDFGAMDWQDTHMALREFVSNAIDRTIREHGDFRHPGLSVTVEPKRRAKAGHTRIFVSLHGEGVQDFFQKLGDYFLHFGRPGLVGEKFLPKPQEGQLRVYREGVFVRALEGKPSAFDYNFPDHEINIDECRNSSEYAVRASIAQAINRAPSEVLTSLFQEMSQRDIYETVLDDFYLSYSESDSVCQAWQKGWEAFAGDAIACSASDGPLVEFAVRKGKKVAQVRSPSFLAAATKLGIPTLTSVFGAEAGQGKEPVPPTAEAKQAVETVWSWCEAVGMTNGRSKPEVHCYRELMNSECETLGYQKGDAVYIREDVGGKLLLKTALEEVVHYITGSGDCSRDFQQFAFDMIVELAL